MKRLVVANWKMNPVSSQEADRLFVETERSAGGNIEVVVCPPFVFLEKAKMILEEVKVGAQNCSFINEGSLTGEISPRMLKNLGVDYVIIGHSERRNNFNENDKVINEKVKIALENKLSVILCVGESEEERNSGNTNDVIKRQLKEGLEGVKEEIIIAYEPVWAIGSGKACDPDEAEKTRLMIEEMINSRIIYGGSVDPLNVIEYVKKTSFSGFLVGGASLDSEKFGSILRSLRI